MKLRVVERVSLFESCSHTHTYTQRLMWSSVGIVAKDKPQEDQDVIKVGKDPNEAMQDKLISNIEERTKRTHTQR